VVRAVVVGAGAVPNVEWLATSGLEIDNGVVVDESLLATDRVAAIGDVASFSWRNVFGTERVRIEHWQVANDHAAHLAHVLVTGEELSSPMIPYFLVRPIRQEDPDARSSRGSDHAQIVSGSVAQGKWTALYSRDGVLSGVVSLSQPRALDAHQGVARRTYDARGRSPSSALVRVSRCAS